MFATTIFGHVISTVWALIVLFFWILIAFWPAMIAKGKGYSFLLFFILSLPFWWIMIFVALIMPPKTPPAATPPAAPAA